MAKVSPDLIKQLRDMSSASPAKCEVALKANKGDVDKALRALIAAGDVTAAGLDPRLTTREHYALVDLAEQQRKVGAWAAAIAGLLGTAEGNGPDNELRQLRDQLSGASPLDAMVLNRAADTRRQALEALRKKEGRRGKPDDGAAADPVERLHRVSSLPPDRCDAALREAKGDLDEALRALIASGEVLRGDLDPDLTTDEHYALCEIKRQSDHQQTMDASTRRMLGLTAATFKSYRDQLSGKLPIDKDFMRTGRFNRDAALGSRAPRRSKKPSALDLAPFPRLKYTGDWEGADVLPAWAGFQARHGPYTSRSSRKSSTGKVELRVVAPPGDDDNPPPAKEQVAAYRYLKENEEKVRDAVVAAVFKEYPKLRRHYAAGELDENEYHMPEIREKAELKKLIGVGIVHVLNEAKGGHAYVGFEMGCTWDEEHGLGVLTHKDRVVEIGQADAAFVGHSVKKDGGKLIKG
jgi:hypothetical protein